jgi:translocation and assembly module TamB
MSSEQFFLQDMGLPYMPDDATVSFVSQGEGTFDDPVITLNANVLGGTFEGRDMGPGTIQSTIRNQNISVDAALFNEKVTLKGSGQLDERIPWKADLQIQPARYDFIVSSILKDIPEDLQLSLEGEIHMHGDRHSLNAAAEIRHLSLSLFEQTFTNDSDIRIMLQNKSVSFPSFILQSGATSFELKGGMDVGQRYNLHLKGSSALVPLKGFSKKIGYLKGNADFILSVTGTWDNPDINGKMNVTDTSFGLRDYPAYISAINGYLYIDEDRVVLENLSGKIGGGTVLISGHLDLEAFHMKRFYIEAELEDITAVISKDFHINFKGELIYKGTMQAQSLTGDIFIKRAKYREMVEWRSWLLKAKSKDIPTLEEPILEKTELNIRISGSDNIAIDNNIARAPVRIRGDMIVKGTLTKPILFGRIESNEGYVYFRNNEFEIIYLSADFADPNRIKPVINLSADTTVQGYDIRMNLEGQLDHFTLALSSDPYLEEVDILSLLTVGQVGKHLKGLEGGVGAGQATSFLTGKAQDVIEERLRTLTGLDRFQVEPYVSETTSTVEPRVTVSERLIGDSLFVTYTTSLGSTEEEIIKLEYPLGKHLSLIGVRDERGGIGGDVQFRFSFQ